MLLMDESLSLNLDLIKLFTQDLFTLENKSSKTVRNYTQVIRELFEFAKQQPVTVSVLKKFVQHHSRKKSKATQALWISALKSFFRWARMQKLVQTKALESCLQAPRQTRKLLRVVDEEDLFILDKYLDNSSPEERLLFELLYGSGLRFSEALNLCRKDVLFAQNQLRILGKGEKLRHVPATKRGLKLLEMLLPPEIHQPLWHTNDQTRLRSLVAQWGRDCGLEKKVGKLHPHKLRHSIATHLVRRGAALPRIQKFLGHSELSTTQRYTHLDIQDLIRVYDQSFPQNMKTPFEEKKK